MSPRGGPAAPPPLALARGAALPRGRRRPPRCVRGRPRCRRACPARRSRRSRSRPGSGDLSRPAPLASLAALSALRYDQEPGRPRVGGVPVVVAVQRLDDESGLREEELGLAAIEIVKRHRSADPANGSAVGGLVVPEPLAYAV